MMAETLLDNLTTAVLQLDEQLRITGLNPAGEQLFGISQRYCRTQPLTQALPYLEMHVSRLRQALSDRASYTRREISLKRFHGEPLTVDCTVTPLTDASGEQGLVLEFIARDRQQRISQDDHMRSQNMANREMLRGLAHEIKNPLGGLRGAAQLLERELDSVEQKEYTTVIIREADRLRSLVDDMLGPRQPPQRRSLNLHEPLEHVRALMGSDLPPGVEIECDYDPSLPPIHGDREQLVQVFFNLIGNAVAALVDGGHADAPGRITLRTRAQRLFTIGGVQHRLVARIDVIDNGPGIPDELQSRIFLPMVSARSDGTGLGLPIAQYLLELNDGLLECASRPGQTEFSVYLPLNRENQP